MVLEVLKGTRDIYPSEQKEVNRVVSVISRNFEKFGFRPFDTPMIEYFDVLARKYDETAEIVQEIFKVSDRGERSLGLRYDLTTPLCRVVASEKQFKLPFRRYAIGKVFRDGPLKKGRVREFIQCDGDVVGVLGVEVEAEILEMFFSTYSELGLEVEVELNNNKILRGAFLQEGFAESEVESLILSVDKLKKVGVDGVLEEVRSKGFEYRKVEKVIKILSKNSFEKVLLDVKNEIFREGVLELKALTELLEVLGVKYRLNFSMSRGLAIYTGNIWEVYDLKERVTSSLGAGGRYDGVIGEFAGDGRSFPAVGVSFGLVPIMECLKESGLKMSEGTAEYLVVALSEKLRVDAFKVAQKLRKKSNVEIFYDLRLKKAFDYCEFLGISKLVIIGEKEKADGVYVLKDLVSGKEQKVKF